MTKPRLAPPRRCRLLALLCPLVLTLTPPASALAMPLSDGQAGQSSGSLPRGASAVPAARGACTPRLGRGRMPYALTFPWTKREHTPYAPTSRRRPAAQRADERARDSGPLGAVAELRAFAAAFARGQYAAMWARLTPDARAGWGGLADYAAYYRAKFAPVRLLGIDVGAPRLDGAAAHIPLSLHLAWRGAGAPGILNLFQNVEATLVPTARGWRVREAGPLDSSAPILPPSQPPARTLRVPILMYHHVSSAPPLAQSQVGLTVPDSEFQAQLVYLSAHGYRSITLVDLFNALYYGRPLPPRPVVLTFDDGYLDNYTDAFPLLRRYGMAGEFNVIAAYPGITLGVNRYMTWPQIAALSTAGMEVESHTVDHQDLGLMDAAHAVYELRFSRAIIASHIHRAVQLLAYPSGEPFRSGTLAARQRTLTLLPQNGYVGALLDQAAPSTLQNAQTPYQLTRVRVDPGESLTAFAANLQL